jgi:hypothetical protein
VGKDLDVFAIRPVSLMSRGSVFGIVTDYGLDDKRGWSSSPGRVKNFLFSTSSRPNLLSNEYRGSFPGVKE